MRSVDYLIIGSGIAGASAAFELADHGSVLLAEREAHHGYHTTGRSAALYAESYGNAPIRALTSASRGFYDAPPAGFAEHPLLTPRGCLHIAAPGQEAELEALRREIAAKGLTIERLTADEVRARVPVLRPEAVSEGLYEPDASDIDVNGLHQGFLRGAKAKGGEALTGAELTALARNSDGLWQATFGDGSVIVARVVVNAAGAWADEVAKLAGATPVGLTPLRRTAIMIEAPAGWEIDHWPAVIDVAEAFYFKPDAGRLLASPADETPSPPCDAAPEELDIAICVDRIQAAADIPVRRILRSWAGLRTFAPDRTPVIGYDETAPGFFWLAGQGGYGVQTAPAAGRMAAALALGRAMPADLAARGLDAATFAPGRLR
jgi:D-arginine dehydrogenase